MEVWLTDSLEELSSPKGAWADQRLAESSGGPSDQRSSPPVFGSGGAGTLFPASGGSIALPQLRQTNDESPPGTRSRVAASVHCVPQYGQRMADMITAIQWLTSAR